MERKRLTADQVKALAPGTRVSWMHHDRHGELQCGRCMVVLSSSKSKRLSIESWWPGEVELMPIRKLDGEREWYEEGWRW